MMVKVKNSKVNPLKIKQSFWQILLNSMIYVYNLVKLQYQDQCNTNFLDQIWKFYCD
jgi:hypothetical protein